MIFPSIKRLKKYKIGQGVKDVISGRAMIQGVKVIYRGTLGNALKVEKRHERITTPK